jgi:multidrug efflux system membrane fusion protein
MSVVTANPPLPGARPVRSGRRWFRWVVSLGVLAGLGWGVRAAYQSYSTTAPARPARGASVEAGAARRGAFPVVLTGLGTVTPVATSVVKSQISGQLVKVLFKEGQLLKAGDVLAQVDARPYRLALANAEGQLKRDEALLENARRDLKRYESLRNQIKDAVSEQQIDTQRSLIGQDEGVVAMDRAQVDTARLNLDYTNIVSLIDGRVGLRTVDPGNYVQANDANGVAVVTQLSPITVVFTLPAGELPPVLKRFRAGEELGVSVYDADRAKPLAQGKLIAIDNQIDTATGTVKLRALFPNEDERLYPNQFVNADVLVEKLDNVLLAPTAAIQRGAKGAFSYVIGPDNTVAARPIAVGPGNGTDFVVEKGLSDAERVVTLGADRLREGASVSLPEPRKAEGDGTPREGAPREGKKDRKS